MKDPKTTITGIAQAVVAILGVIGIHVSPEQQNNIVAGTLALLGVLSAIKGHYTKDKE